MTPRVKVLIVLAVLLAGWVVLVVADVAWGSPVPSPSPLAPTWWEIGLWILAGLCVLVFAIGAVTGLALIVIAGVGRLWDRRPAARRADAFNAAIERSAKLRQVAPNFGASYDAVQDFDANVDPAIAERLQRKAKYDTYAAEMYSAFRELGDDDLIKNVIDLWSRKAKP